MEQIVTGEAVILDLPYARFPTRILARLIDMLIELVAFFTLAVVIGVAASSNALDTAAVAAISISGSLLIIVGYPVICETLGRGRTVGKLALGLRVVADDGGPERFRQALVRALAGVIECWALFGAPALITSMLSARGKRLGDIFAGTFVVRERAPKAAAPYAVPAGAYPRATPIHPGLRSWAASLELSALPEQLAASAASYLSRFGQLNEAARDHLGRQLAADVAARVSPPPPLGVTPADYLHTVLAERGNRALARSQPPQSVPWQAPPQSSRWQAPAQSVPWQAPAQGSPPQDPPAEPAPPVSAAPRYPADPQDTVFTPPA